MLRSHMSVLSLLTICMVTTESSRSIEIIYVSPLFLDQLKRIDLTGNQISKLDEDTFRTLPQLQDLFLADNRIPVLPELPATMRHIDVRNNHLTSAGMHREAFKASNECYKE